MKTLIVAPHPDDEVLGVGGTILKYKQLGHSVGWLIITKTEKELNWEDSQIKKRKKELKLIQSFFNFDSVFNLNLPTTKLDSLPFSDIVQKISKVLEVFQPTDLFIPHLGDIHSDHQIVHRATISCTKWFRHPYIKKTLAYETLSETDLGEGFFPNVFIDISNFLDLKIKAMKIYQSEVKSFPFPRSAEAIKALAKFRGSSSGFKAAEAFKLIKERR